jgi:hypothetical protein
MNGLLEKATQFTPNDLSGPYSLSEGTLVRGLRYDGRNWHGEIGLRDGRWEECNFGPYEPRIGDVTALRAEQRAPKPVPPPPVTATQFVWVWSVGYGRDLSFEYRRGKRPTEYRNTCYVPTSWHSVIAFDAQGEPVGYWSPHYAASSERWELPDHWDHLGGTIYLRGTQVAESLADARAALDRSPHATPGSLTP